MRFHEGETAYIIVNNMYAKPCTVLSYSCGMYVVSLGSGAIRVRESRLFRTAAETGKPMARREDRVNEVVASPEQRKNERVRLPWDWE